MSSKNPSIALELKDLEKKTQDSPETVEIRSSVLKRLLTTIRAYESLVDPITASASMAILAASSDPSILDVVRTDLRAARLFPEKVVDLSTQLHAKQLSRIPEALLSEIAMRRQGEKDLLTLEFLCTLHCNVAKLASAHRSLKSASQQVVQDASNPALSAIFTSSCHLSPPRTPRRRIEPRTKVLQTELTWARGEIRRLKAMLEPKELTRELSESIGSLSRTPSRRPPTPSRRMSRVMSAHTPLTQKRQPSTPRPASPGSLVASVRRSNSRCRSLRADLDSARRQSDLERARLETRLMTANSDVERIKREMKHLKRKLADERKAHRQALIQKSKSFDTALRDLKRRLDMHMTQK
eukprot:gnl/Dysnectes_brevis/5595_a8119_512.p1 GENE.gnl/Dysnectes_brevis/5595_a8119_512~~gnl/Dysnectes_brevis/5595_a8119_512.p1  ORF type:complete len:354 (+),score=79.00 gnl/Dysnectes_brevis/5595_a8119_512:67-1128(+)